MRYIVNESTDPYFNLALDEYCLENVKSREPYFFLWRNSPAVIIGLNQNAFGEVNLEYLKDNGIKLARRVTGGGAVYHDLQNMNYTIIGKNPSPEPMVEALRALGVPAELTGRNDIFVEGRKVSGYARRVAGDQEIIHGTLMYDVDLDTLAKALDTPTSKAHAKGISSVKSRVANLKDYLPGIASVEELMSRLKDLLSGGDGEIKLSEEQAGEVRRMAREKFSTWDFIYGHSREADFLREAKLACGTVKARISVDKGLVRDLSFEGDYLFDSPTAGIEEALSGVRFDYESILDRLRETGTERYFRGSTPEEIARLIAYD